MFCPQHPPPPRQVPPPGHAPLGGETGELLSFAPCDAQVGSRKVLAQAAQTMLEERRTTLRLRLSQGAC